MRLYRISAAFFSMIFMAILAPSALANPGGTAAGGTSPSSRSTAPVPGVPGVHHAPITARTSSLTYKGPVYEKTPAGEVVPYTAPLSPSTMGATTGGSVVSETTNTKPELLVPGASARVVNGQAAAPESAPAAVQEIIWAGNQIVGLPYIYGGGHASFSSPGYDCSGTVSYALHGADLLNTPMDSGEFESWDSGGIGQWVTIFANGGHAYMTVAGIRLDTSAADDPSNQQGPRWRPLRQSNSGYVVRHPTNF